MITRGNVFKNWQLCPYFLEMYWRAFTNTSGNVLKKLNKKCANLP